jgi:hypothetical protein
MDDRARAGLLALVQRYGADILADPERCEALVADYCFRGLYGGEYFVLASALREGIPASLLAPPPIPRNLVILNLAKRLQDHRKTDEEAALWAVESWAAALGQTPTPDPPADLVAVAGDRTVTLTWKASPAATLYHVSRSTASGGPFTTIGEATSCTFTDAGLNNGQSYYYVVSAVAADAESKNSQPVGIRPNAAPPPSLPGVENFKVVAGHRTADLSWTASQNAVRYHIKRATRSGGPYTTIGESASSKFGDAGLTNGETYYYVVSAVTTQGEGGNSREGKVKPSFWNGPAGLVIGILLMPVYLFVRYVVPFAIGLAVIGFALRLLALILDWVQHFLRS